MLYGNYHTAPTKNQLDLLLSLDYHGPPPKTSREASILIAKRSHPNNLQKNYLTQLNYSGSYPPTEYDADVLIDSLKPPTVNQLSKIKNMGGKKIPQSFNEANEIILSLCPITPGQQIFLEKHNIRNKPRNEKEASDIIDQYKNNTLIQPDPCPKCNGDRRYTDGYRDYSPCPYCDGDGREELYDESKGDLIISEQDSQNHENECDEENN